MNPQDKPQDSIFQEAFDGLEVTPPAGAWDNIDSKLKGSRRRIIAYWVSGVAAAVLGAAILFPSINEVNQETIQKEARVERPAEKVETSTTSTSISSTENPITDTTPEPDKHETSSTAPQKQQADPSLIESAKPMSYRMADASQASMGNEESGRRESARTSAESKTKGNESKIESMAAMEKKTISSFAQANKPFQLDRKEEPYVEECYKARLFKVALGYAPIFTQTNFIQLDDIPVSNTIVQPNLKDQKVQDYDLSYFYSDQVGVYGGMKIMEHVELFVGVEYVHWKGQMDLYLSNEYEFKTTINQEIADTATIREIADQINQGNLTDKGQLVVILGGGTGPGTGTFLGSDEKGAIITDNNPSDFNITDNETDEDFEQITITERVTYDDTITTQFSYSYFEVPVMLRVEFGHKKLKANVSGGFSTIFASRLDLQSVAISQRDRTTEISSTKASFQQWNAILGLGVNYQFVDRWSINAGPVAKWGLNSNADQQGNRLRSLGFQVAVEYKL